MIKQIIEENQITVPIIADPLNDNLYLVGANKLPCQLKQDNVVVRVAAGTDKLDDYVLHNHRTFEKILVIHMINSNQSLEWVTDQLMQGKKIKGTVMSGVKARDSSSSPVRHIEPLRAPTNYSPNSRQNNSPYNRSSPNAQRNSNVMWMFDARNSI